MWYLYAVPVAASGITRVTISTPYRRIDVAVPDTAPLAEFLPELLRHAGDGLADEGTRHGGWLLRRADGIPLRPSATLAKQGVVDGAVLHLVPARTDWPEIEYDDVVEVIAEGARRHAPGWHAGATRVTALVAAGAALALGLAALVQTGPQWTPAALVALGIAAALIAAGTVASRAFADRPVGACLAAYGLPYAATGGAILLATEPVPGRPEYLLVGSVALLLASAVAAAGVGYGLRVFVAGATAGVLGAVGALIGLVTGGAAAALLALLVGGVAGVPLLAVRLGKLPLPVGPATTPERQRVFAAVARTDEVLSGALMGVSVVGVAAAWLVVPDGLAGALLAGVVGLAFLLRARLFLTVRHRLPLLAAGTAVLGLLALEHATGVGAAVALAVAAVLIAVAGNRTPSPYLGRAGDLLDLACVVAAVPLACVILGLFGLARGLGG
jgi:type VII secretion integral membrane protein EccD